MVVFDNIFIDIQNEPVCHTTRFHMSNDTVS